MTQGYLILAGLLVLSSQGAQAQRARVTVSGGDVAASRGSAPADRSRLAPRLPGLSPEMAARAVVSGDSAQRLALADFGWRGRVSSVEIDEVDSRLFWDVKIVPDSTRETLVRYRLDARSGGIIDIREFSGVRGLARHPRR